jgi:putative effector of murein hydrolase
LILGIAILVAMILNVQIERATIRGAGHGSFAHAIGLIFARRKVPVRQ